MFESFLAFWFLFFGFFLAVANEGRRVKVKYIRYNKQPIKLKLRLLFYHVT